MSVKKELNWLIPCPRWPQSCAAAIGKGDRRSPLQHIREVESRA